MFDINFIVEIVLQVYCIFIFLSVFFFTYAAGIEKEIVINQVNFMVDHVYPNGLNFINPGIKSAIVNTVNNIPENNSIQQNQLIEKNNKDVINSVINTAKIPTIVIGIFIVATFLLKHKYSFFQKIHIFELIKNTAIIVGSVALTEFVFLTYFTRNLISVNPNLLKSKLIDKLNNTMYK
jgi:ABC-type phosphate transport system permease subunit